MGSKKPYQSVVPAPGELQTPILSQVCSPFALSLEPGHREEFIRDAIAKIQCLHGPVSVDDIVRIVLQVRERYQEHEKLTRALELFQSCPGQDPTSMEIAYAGYRDAVSQYMPPQASGNWDPRVLTAVIDETVGLAALPGTPTTVVLKSIRKWIQYWNHPARGQKLHHYPASRTWQEQEDMQLERFGNALQDVPVHGIPEKRG